MNKKREIKDCDLGFGYFSTLKTANDWKTRNYDGLESTSSIDIKCKGFPEKCENCPNPDCGANEDIYP